MDDSQKMLDYLDNYRPTGRPVAERKEPAKELQQLDFLLGRMVSHFNTGVRFEAETRPIMGGHYYVMDLHATHQDGTPKLDGIWIIGWSEVDNHFESYYVDSLGTMGTSTSPGWEDGHLAFVGSHVVGEVGVRTMTKDFYTPIDDDHFRLDAYVEVDGEWKLYDVQQCERTRL
ncbi:MAG TPA: DUF1579 family protein [Micromonosporaceae bacterium]|nr:DUF1579 family protein [Micromonosporaceae bacterium]